MAIASVRDTTQPYRITEEPERARLLLAQEAAELLRVTPNRLYDLAKRGGRPVRPYRPSGPVSKGAADPLDHSRGIPTPRSVGQPPQHIPGSQTKRVRSCEGTSGSAASPGRL